MAFFSLPRALVLSPGGLGVQGSLQQLRGSSVTSVPAAAASRSLGKLWLCWWEGGAGGDGTSEGMELWDTSVPCSEGRAGNTLGMGQVRVWSFGTPVSPAWLRGELGLGSPKCALATSVDGACGVSVQLQQRC